MTPYEYASVAVALLFVGGLLTAASTTAARALRYRRRGIALPRLLVRDLIVFGGFAITIVVVYIVRALGLGPAVQGQLWWLAVSSIPALVAVFAYCYFEVFVIDRGAD